MENKGPAAFKYQVPGRSAAGWVAALIVALIVTVLSAANLGAQWLFGLLLPLGIFIYLIRRALRPGLVIAPRYLIAGEQILYYATVARAVVDRSRQTLTLVSDRGRQLVIEAERFPTNARKEFKIKANKAAKFDKALAKILSRLPGVTPEYLG